MRNQVLTKKQKRELIKAVISGDKFTVQEILNNRKREVFKLENGQFYSIVSGIGCLPTTKKPKKGDFVIMYNIDSPEENNYPGTIFLKSSTKNQMIEYWRTCQMTDEEIIIKLKEYETSGCFDLDSFANEFYKLFND